MADSARVQDLKTEGNALFSKGEWSAAYDKYAEAVQYDDQSAILYANRAACAIHLQKFVEAKIDAHKAVTLDPNYAKGWGRLAAACTGLLEYKESAEHWRKALATFSSENLSPAEQKQKNNCEYELKTALQRAALADKENVIVAPPHSKGELPWDRCKAMEAKLLGSLPDSANSSAWVMLRAAKLWDAGVAEMKEIKELVSSQGITYSGLPGVIGKLTDAILTDMRVFRIEDAFWIPMYNRQISFEEWKFGAWPSLPPQAVKGEALKKQQQGGWDAVRPALDVTVRAWIMQAFTLNRPTGNGNPTVSVIKYETALEILYWGRTGPWKDVPMSEKGVIFEDYFVRAVRQLRLDAFGNVVGRPESHGPEDVWESMFADARSLVDEMPVVGLAALPVGEHEPGFVLAYGVYPKAVAFSMIGLYYHHAGWLYGQQRKAGDHTAAENIVRAHYSYINATKCIPQDDEKHAWFLAVAVQMVQMSGAPFEAVLGLTEQLRQSLPVMKTIWEHSGMAMQGSHIAHSMILRLEEKIKKDLADGKIKRGDLMDAKYNPRRSWDVYC